MEYTANNIDSLLLQRHTAKEIRNAGGRFKGIPKQKPEQDAAFWAKLEELMMQPSGLSY